MVTDRAPALAHVIDDLLPGALHTTEQYDNNRVECDHGRLKPRLRPMRGLKTNRTASVLIRGHAFVGEPAARALRTRNRHDTCAPAGHRLRRTPTGDLTATPCRRQPSRPAIDQRNRAPFIIALLSAEADGTVALAGMLPNPRKWGIDCADGSARGI